MGENFKKLCRIAGETIVKYGLITGGDHILVGISGGKDSLVMMQLLDHLQRSAPVKFKLTAATFDPGFEGFDTANVAEYCKKNGWEHHTVRLKIADIIAEKGFENSPCVLCSRLRRGKLYGLAGELKCGKLALGQHLDDIIVSFMMSLCRGQGLTTMAPSVKSDNPAHPTVIRPLALVPEALIEACAAELSLPISGVCRYREQLESGDRKRFKDLLEDLSAVIPDLRSNIAHSLTRPELDHLLIPPEQK